MLTGRMDESCLKGSEDLHCTLPETNFPFRKDMANLGWLGDVPSFSLTVLFGRLSLWPATFTGLISFHDSTSADLPTFGGRGHMAYMHIRSPVHEHEMPLKKLMF